MSSTVIASLESEDGTHCVDFFTREDGTFGFEQYRGEYDGSSRWQSLSEYARKSFASGQEALHVAKQQVSWLQIIGLALVGNEVARWSARPKSTVRTVSGGLSLKTGGNASILALPCGTHFGHVAFVQAALPSGRKHSASHVANGPRTKLGITILREARRLRAKNTSIPTVRPNPSIERTSQRPLRALCAAAHVER